MSSIVLSDEFLAKVAGWDVLKQARGTVAAGKVLSSEWKEPVLRGVVQEGTTSYRCGLIIKSALDIENLCTCRASRSWGTICAHSVAAGLHHLRGQNRELVPSIAATSKPRPAAAPKAPKTFRRIRREPGGTPVVLHLIFPPNIDPALAKGRSMIFFEAEWKEGRSPLDVLPQERNFSIAPEDAAILDAIEDLAGDTPGMLQITNGQLTGLLEKLVDHPRLYLGKSESITVARDPLQPALKATLEPNGEIALALQKPLTNGPLLRGTTVWLYSDRTFRRIHLPAAAAGLLDGPVRISREQIPFFLSQDWPAMAGAVSANFTLDDFRLSTPVPGIRLDLTGGLAGLQGALSFTYAGRTVTKESGAFWMPDPSNPKHYLARHLEAERAAQARLTRAGFTGPHAEGTFQLAGQNAVLNFFARDFSRLEREWKVTLEERLQRSTAQNLERIEPRFEVAPSGEQWFDFGVIYEGDGGTRYSNTDVQALLRSGQSHKRLPNGKFAIIDTGAVEELQEVLLDCSPRQHEQGYRIANAQAGFLANALGENPAWKIRAPEQWRSRATAHSGEARMPVPPLGHLEEILRPYQKHGVAWLEFLRQNHFGGILADEMGLGKTLQALAFLHSVRARTSPSERRPSLIVCPTSLVFNWLAEARRFTPDLKAIGLHGARRHEKFAELAQADLLVTSYALIRRDLEAYGGTEFDTVVLDEAQHIKNRQTQNAQAVKALRTRNRLVLTGTPLENSVLDLWSIFDFLMPGYLGTAADFKERYEAPIAREKNAEAQARLARRVRPFLLRRLKKEVAKDLPEKIEQVSFCELTAEQQEIYQKVLEAGRKEVLEAVGDQGAQKSRMVILTALLRLRQVCCDLRLLELEKVAATNSSKVELFHELLQEVLDGGHRVLVFSQFVKMLHLLRDALDQQQIKYAYLDGSTVDRAKVVQDFQSNRDVPVFLISLKAGGVGLNLTAADTVIHFDPWWNPAVEAQATDRAHRIGQTQVVTSYKLIARGTVEEKILNLQNRKRELIAATLSGEEDLASALTWEELQGLLE
jgi:superfamily II DNA or RNA helicase